ncbi:hypothetical protein VPGG_00004 [Vibrio phage VBM1]|uniref:hypothetical protein n=1 Tax=Vibrio phage VBM1 TaxID=754074 RepID=UPI0002C137A1|nr:hypothetical protein VPGG_00004 [Vibrio phage VBM1]AGH07321.1 hypothetical protein VPGG_00004 [Vibrio phage VBM1]
MREIKFRGINTAFKSSIEIDNVCDIDWLHDEVYFDNGTDAPTSIEDAKLMQYTGLKDKNDVEIYEGDVVKSGLRGGNVLSTYSIEYDSVYGCWYGSLISSQNLGNKDCQPIGEIRFNAEVIGNIHQNPELTK